VRESGIIFHAKHAYMPNSLGYCGPDEKGKIRQELEEGRVDEELIRSLERFEAAYPFLKLIARSTGNHVFDYAVPEAYWIGNSLLERVPVPEFYAFSHRELKGRDPGKVREVFRALDGSALPHHTFYVMSTYAASGAAHGPNLTNESGKKLAELIDNCRISWGKVKKVEGKELQVEVRPLHLVEGRLGLASPRLKRVQYNPEVRPFGSVKTGDVVSLHWNYACDVLNSRQSRNIAKYTDADLSLVNRFLATKARRSRV
jgi:hypothetical protein